MYVRVKEQLERRKKRKKRLNYRLKLTGEFSKENRTSDRKTRFKSTMVFFPKILEKLLFFYGTKGNFMW